jgi:2-octaprenyl-6-methoxyphenol hydroxylase
MNHDFDLLIVGGGLVGGSLALALRESGARIGIIESTTESQRLSSPAGERALALSWGSAQILDQLGIWRNAALEKATPITRIHVSDRGHLGKVRLSAQSLGLAALGYVARARALEEGMARRLAMTSMAMLCPARVIGVKAGEDAVHVSLMREGESHALSARLLVAADGGHSTVRSLLGITQSESDYRQSAIVTEVQTEYSHRGVAYERFTASGPLAFLPLGDKRCSVVWTMKPEEVEETLARPEPEFCRRLQAAFGHWLGRITLAARRQAFPLKLIEAERMVDERVVLIGNAMHQIHPVAGQGFNLGLRDAALLAERIVAQLGFGADIGEKTLLDRYAEARQRDLKRVIRSTDGLVRIFSSDDPFVVTARNLGMLTLEGLPAAKRLLMRLAMGRAEPIPRVI